MASVSTCFVPTAEPTAEPVLPAAAVVSDDDEDDSGSGSCLSLAEHEDLRSPEDVSAAIETCKRTILETESSSDERKTLVQRLIRLRILLYDLRERPPRQTSGAQPAGVQSQTRGHVFVGYYEGGADIPAVRANRRRLYCQQCGDGIWVYLESSRHCTECGFSAHTSCLKEGAPRPLMRECVAQKVKSQPDFILDICPERSLPSLKYRCVECDAKLSYRGAGGLAGGVGGSGSTSGVIVAGGVIVDVGQAASLPRLCDYTGLTYCPGCHWNGRAVTPARVLHNWDFEPREVSQASKQYLELMHRKPVINVAKVNPKLLAVVPELNQVQQSRAKLLMMKKYLSVCRLASEKKLLLQLSPRQHFVDSADFYSMQDLQDVNSGVLSGFVRGVLDAFDAHIRSCVLCVAKGFICELCDVGGGGTGGAVGDDEDEPGAAEKRPSSSSGVLFPFDDEAEACAECQQVFHRRCFKTAGRACPKCARLRTKKDARLAGEGAADVAELAVVADVAELAGKDGSN